MENFDTSNSAIVPHSENIADIFFTFSVLKLDTFNCSTVKHSSNIEAMSSTLLVSNFSTFISLRDEQPWNIPFIFLTF